MSENPETEFKEFDEVLKSTDLLIDESVQIYELENERNNVVDELYNSLKIITEFLGFSVDLPPSIFNEDEKTRITFTPSLDIIIRKKNGKIQQKRLDEYSIKKIAAILKHSILPMIELSRKEKLIQNHNITFLKSITNKLGHVQKINEEKTTDNSTSSINQEDRNINQNMGNQSIDKTSNITEAS